MDRSFPLIGGGELSLREHDGRVRIAARRPEDRQGLWKGWLLGPEGRRLLLGTFLPEDGALVLRRDLARSELERQGLWPPAGGEAVLAFQAGPSGPERGLSHTVPAGWASVRDLSMCFRDPVLRAAASGVSGSVCRDGAGGRLTALPFLPGRPLPLTPLFCLMEPVCLEGRLWLQIRLDADGWPLPPKPKEPDP
ncbi:hypothetical protein [Pseudoflavonifractor sp. MSJ-37]|uniref:hypothetical protein n=1 Tax=Pseudoflavonifractor sp. MSJ-37 TaxID=2841531 RepID=UPI001C112EA6|nr:hypothetical protein [Pseudoflavonifractor sp. MSJ-37]MBU5434604.1 hypothetical protein [Pseudoflavonifractor sp. MSJ-37]